MAIPIDTIKEIIGMLLELKEAYEEYADKIEETEFHLRMLQKIIADRDKTAALKASKDGPGRELEKIFTQLEFTVRGFHNLAEGDGEETNGKRKSDEQSAVISPDSSNVRLTTQDEAILKKLRKAKMFAKKMIFAAQAKSKTEELESLTKRMEMVLRMVEIETASAQAHSLAMMAGQNASDLLRDAPECTKEFWQKNFMSRTSIPSTSFFLALGQECGAALRGVLGCKYDSAVATLRSILDSTGDGEIDINEFSAFVGADDIHCGGHNKCGGRRGGL
jgi:hypothetical protein